MCDDLNNFSSESEDHIADVNCHQESNMLSGSNSLIEKLGSKLDNSEQAIRKKSDNFAHSKQKSDCLHEESNLQNDIMNQVEHGPFIKIINKPTFVVVSDGNNSESSMF